MNELYAVIFDGGLKPGDQVNESKTFRLASRFGEALEDLEVHTEIIRLAELELPNDKDNWPGHPDKQQILDEATAADIIVIATPIWWGNHSSLIQRLIEYFDDQNNQDIKEFGGELDGKIKARMESSFSKTACAFLIVGAEDGTQHVFGGLSNVMTWLGCTVAPLGGVTWTHSDDQVQEMIEVASENVVDLAGKLSNEPLEETVMSTEFPELRKQEV